MSIDPNNLSGTASLSFSDDFNTLNLWNGSSGTWGTTWWSNLQTGNGGTLASNGEQQWYINDRYGPTDQVNPWTVNNGILTLTAAPADPAIQPLINGYQYTSGAINSFFSFSQQYGYFEMSAQLPAGQGLWPAFWLVPADGSWPPEIDIMEVLGQDPTTLYTTVHFNTTNNSTGHAAHVADMSQGFHTYGVDWEADYITFYFDHQQVYQVATPADMHKPMYMIANLAVGGYWPGSPDASTHFPAEMKIDYIRAYKAGGNGGTTTPPVPSPPPPPPPSVGTATISISGSPWHPEGNSGTTAFDFTVTRTGDLSGTTQVDYWSPMGWGGSATDAADLSSSTGTATFNPGESSKTITLQIVGDTTIEPDEAFVVNLSNARGGVISNGSATGHIVNDDVAAPAPAPSAGATSVSISGAPSHAEGAAGSAAAFDFTITRTGDVAGATQVDYWIPLGWGGSDADGADFSGSTSSTAYFNPGETSKTITFLANGDGAVEANEAFVVNLANVRGAAMGTGSATGRIMNDDGVASSPLPPPPPPPPPPAASLFTLPTSAAPTNSIIGGSRGETLQGTGGADLLDGRRGADTLAGGAGDDTYVVGQPGDVVQENAGGGVDTVQSSVSSYALSANVENLKLTSTTAAQIGTGNELSNILTANDLGSTLNGAGGNDILIAGRGPDTLTGGIGKDLFQFDKVPGGAGHVTDFAIGQDVLDLRGLFVGAGYHGSNPLADGYISLQSDGAGGTSIWFDADGWAGSATAQRVTTLDHVAPNALQMQTDWVFN